MNAPNAQGAAKKSNGCLIAAGVAGGLFLLFVVFVGVLVYKALNSEQGQRVMKLAGSAIAMTQKATTAPGAAELRALGCTEAMVMDLEGFREIVEEAKGEIRGNVPDDLIVACNMGPLAPAPSCEQVAQTYLRAVGSPPKSFLVVVQRKGRQGSECGGRFDANGAALPDQRAAEAMGECAEPIPPFVPAGVDER